MDERLNEKLEYTSRAIRHMTPFSCEVLCWFENGREAGEIVISPNGLILWIERW